MYINGNTFHVHGSEALMLKCPYYPKPSINLMQSLSKFQWHLKRIFFNPKTSTEPQKVPNNPNCLFQKNYLFIFREREEWGERERNIDQLPLLCAPTVA